MKKDKSKSNLNSRAILLLTYFCFPTYLFASDITTSDKKDTTGVACQDCKVGQISSFVEKTLNAASILSENQKNGVLFNCSKDEIAKLKVEMPKYMAELGIDASFVNIKDSLDGSKLGFVLTTPDNDTNTVNLSKRKEYNIEDDIVELPTQKTKKTYTTVTENGVSRVVPKYLTIEGKRSVHTVSKKEIALSLFQHGRLSEFNNEGCNIQAFKDQIGIRQNTAAWTEELSWGFPDGKGSAWNPKYWDDSPLPKRNTAPHVAINDIFMYPDKYSMGCYSASKVVMSQGLLDYYTRVRPDPEKLAKIEKAMLVDKAPLRDVEPGSAWDFIQSMTPEELIVPGKILTVKKGVAKDNFIAGDWSYIKNMDDKSSEKSGYEGSNAVYLGRGNFDDYYGEMPNKHYTFIEKINEVYQWQNGVFTYSESSQKKAKKLSLEEFDHILNSPEEGGILSRNRIEPKVY